MGTSTLVVSIELRYTTSVGYQLRTGTQLDGGAWSYTSWYSITDAQHYLEIDLQEAESPQVGDEGAPRLERSFADLGLDGRLGDAPYGVEFTIRATTD